MLRSMWWMIAAHLWQTTLVLALLLALDLTILRRAPARFSRLLWIAGLLKLLLPLQIFGPLVGRWLPADPLGAISFVLYPPLVAEPALVPVTAMARPLLPHLDGFAVLTAAWLAGALLIGMRWARVAHRRRRPPACESDPRVTRALIGTSISPARIRIVPGRSMPCIGRVFRPRILLPASLLDQVSSDELRAVLLHEDAHLRRGDIWLGLIERFALVLFYYYPPLWLLRRRLHAAVEMASDEYVLAHGIPAETYSGALARTLRACIGAVESPAIAGRSRSLLAHRFRRIAASGRYVTMSHHRIAVALACLVVAMASLLPLSPASIDRPSVLESLDAAEVPVMLNFKGTPLSQVLRALSAACGFEFEHHGANPTVSLQMSGPRPLRETLDDLGTRYNLRYKVTAPNLLIVEGQTSLGSETTSGFVLSADMVPPRLIEGVDTVYPARARSERVEGTVLLQALITSGGRVDDLQVLRVEPRDYEFETAALEAVRQWRYEPATRDGMPVDTYFTVKIAFTLE